MTTLPPTKRSSIRIPSETINLNLSLSSPRIPRSTLSASIYSACCAALALTFVRSSWACPGRTIPSDDAPPTGPSRGRPLCWSEGRRREGGQIRLACSASVGTPPALTLGSRLAWFSSSMVEKEDGGDLSFWYSAISRPARKESIHVACNCFDSTFRVLRLL